MNPIKVKCKLKGKIKIKSLRMQTRISLNSNTQTYISNKYLLSSDSLLFFSSFLILFSRSIMLQFYTFLLRQPASKKKHNTTYNIINNIRNSIKIFLSKAPIYNRKSNTQRNENETVPLKN